MPRMPSLQTILKALDIYRKYAYGGPWPDSVRHLMPDTDGNPSDWLMNDMAEREPEDSPPEEIDSVAFRLGNALYPNMKLKLTRTPEGDTFIFTVDAHDEVLIAEEGSPDRDLLEELKAHNAALCRDITREWDRAGIQTEKGYLRKRIRRDKRFSNR